MDKLNKADVGKVLFGCTKVILFHALLFGFFILLAYVVIPSANNKLSSKASTPTPYIETEDDYNRRRALDEAYQSGYDDGHNEGYKEGYDEGSELGYEGGYSDGFFDGSTAGFEDGRRNVYNDLRSELLELYDIDIADYLDSSVENP